MLLTNAILAIDPGTEVSTAVLCGPGAEGGLAVLRVYRDLVHLQMLHLIDDVAHDHGGSLVIEDYQSFGMAVGREVFQTVKWAGRYWERGVASGLAVHWVFRKDVKLHLCHSSRAKDANVRQALIDQFGGSQRAAVGTKKEPGPLHGVAGHAWSAVAVAVTWAETCDRQQSDAA